MDRLILHHRYSLGMAWDLSGLNHHGTLREVTPGTAAFRGSLEFDSARSRIDVRPSQPLRELSSFRCSVRFCLRGNSDDRYNLVESQGSFAFFIEPPFRLAATVMDANEDWTGALTGELRALADGQWHRADCGHDGIDTMWLAIDAAVVATATGVPGPVRGVGPNGLTIGHWPESEDRFAFDGHISEVWLWNTRPDQLVDACCIDTEPLAAAEQALRDRGWTLATVRERIRTVSEASAELRRMVPAANGPAFDRDVASLNRAIRDQDWEAVDRLSTQLRTEMRAHVPDARGRELAALIAPLFGDLVADPAFMSDVARAMVCAPATGTLPPLDPNVKQQPWRPWGTTEAPKPEPTDDPDPHGIPRDVGYGPGAKPKRTQRHKEGDAEPRP